jgi:hypothetical protein
MRLRLTLLLLGSWLVCAATAGAQSLTINGGNTYTGRTAEDFATTVIADPWDFENRDDYAYSWSSDASLGNTATFAGVPDLVNGVLHGTLRGSQPQIQMQFEGVDGAFNVVGRNGVHFPIDANRYKRVSFRMKRIMVPEQREWMGVTFFKGTNRSTSSTIGGMFGFRRGRGPDVPPIIDQSPDAIGNDASRYHIYAIDMDRAGGNGAAWSDVVRGLEIQLGYAPGLANTVLDLDWVRLTQRGTAMAPLAWSGLNGAVTITAVHTETGDQVQLTPEALGLGPGATFNDNSSYNWDYGYLPPGTWTITARSSSRSASATLVVDAPPVIQITEPDATGGRDWATTTLGDAWDMTNAQDVTRYGRLWQVPAGVFGENGLEGTTRGGSWSDVPDTFVQFLDNWDKDASSYPNIDANTYHRLSYTIQTDHPELMGADSLSFTWGSVSRVAWAKANNPQHRVTQDLYMMDGIPNTFVMDLATLNDLSTIEDQGGNWGPAWNNDGGWISTFRINLNEAFTGRGFRIANVKLAADDAPNGNGFFTIKWRAFDATFTRAVAGAGASDAKVTLYYYPASNPAGRVQIAANVPAGNGQYSWDVAGLAPGLYFVYGVITDNAGNSQSRASTGPVRVPSLEPGLRTDSNSNGLPDWWENRFAVSNPAGDDDGDGVSNVAEYQAGTNPLTANVWNLSEGATGFFTQRLALANPDASPAEVSITYLRSSGAPIVRSYSLLPYGRLTINVNDIAGLTSAEVSAVVTANSGGVIAERTMFWGDQWYGGHTGKALSKPSNQWFLAEGAANNKFSTFILLANANAQSATVNLQFLPEGPVGAPTPAPIPYTRVVPGFSRSTVWVNGDVPAMIGSFSTSLSSDLPITVERSLYFNGPRSFEGGHETAAVSQAQRHWYVAEGATGFFDEYVLLANPNPTATRASVRYLTPTQTFAPVIKTLPPNSRTTIEVKAEPGLRSAEVSVDIEADQPIVVERAMYWPTTGWIESHASAGITETGTVLALAEGEVGGSRGFESYILIANPSTQDATVTLSFMREGGRPLVTSAPIVVKAGTRLTRWLGQYIGADKLSSGEKVGILIRSTNDVPVVAERTMYWNGGGVFWGGGSNETAFTLK